MVSRARRHEHQQGSAHAACRSSSTNVTVCSAIKGLRGAKPLFTNSRGLLTRFARLRSIQHLGDPRPRSRGRIGRQSVAGEESMRDDLGIRLRRHALREALRSRTARHDRGRKRSGCDRSRTAAVPAGSRYFPLPSVSRSSASRMLSRASTPPPGRCQPGYVGMLDQENPPVRVDRHAAHAEREPAGKAPVQMHQAANHPDRCTLGSRCRRFRAQQRHHIVRPAHYILNRLNR